MATVGHRMEIFTPVCVCYAPIPERIGMTCIDADGLVILLYRPLIIALMGVSHATTVERIGIVGR